MDGTKEILWSEESKLGKFRIEIKRRRTKLFRKVDGNGGEKIYTFWTTRRVSKIDWPGISVRVRVPSSTARTFPRLIFYGRG